MRACNCLFAAVLGGLLVSTVHASPIVVTIPEADFDRWMYPFNSSPGTRQTAPIFGAVGETSFDDRDGQFLIGFNTAAALIPTSLPSGQKLRIDEVVVSATHFSGGFTYDASFDDYRSYLPAADPSFQADSDAGRPIELTGVGLRGGYAQLGFGPTVPGPLTFEQGDIYAFGDPTATGIRNAFAADALGNDVSNVIKQGLWSFTPWAIGTTNLAPGSVVNQGVPGVSPGSTFQFSVDLSLPGVEQYLQQGLAQGGLYFAISSFHGASQTGGTSPNFYTRDNFDPAAIAPSLMVKYSIVPEPSTWALLMAGLIAVAARRLSARRNRA